VNGFVATYVSTSGSRRAERRSAPFRNNDISGRVYRRRANTLGGAHPPYNSGEMPFVKPKKLKIWLRLGSKEVSFIPVSRTRIATANTAALSVLAVGYVLVCPMCNAVFRTSMPGYSDQPYTYRVRYREPLSILRPHRPNCRCVSTLADEGQP